MMVLLRDIGSGSYYGGGQEWVKAVETAAHFETIEAAGRKALECGRNDVDVVLRYDNPECELALNLVFCVRAADQSSHRTRV